MEFKTNENDTLFLSNCNDRLPIVHRSISFFSCNYNINNYHNSLFSKFNIVNKICSTRAVKKRRSEYLAGRICAVRALSKLETKYNNVSSNPDRSPKWPEGIVGSITHTNDTAAAIVAHSKAVSALGIDYEHIFSDALANEIKSQILRHDEYFDIYADTHKFNIFVTLLFSAKECLYKALYPHVRKYLDFHDLIVTNIGPNTLTLRLCVDFGYWHKGFETDIYYKKINNSILTLTSIEN